MPILGIVKRSAYFDSVALMLAQRDARGRPDVEEIGLVMATESNKALLRESGLDFPDLAAAGADDLVAVARASTVEAARDAISAAQEALTRRPAASGDAYRPKTVASALQQLPQATLAVISVPGRFAKGVAQEALDAGLHVLLFSDNVPIEHEIELKTRSRARGLLLMGPDCGTALIGGAALGFANKVTSGCIGLVAAAGTGLQEVTSLIDRFGGGISHAIGTGGRDLSSPVGGATMLQGLRALALDLQTEVIVLVSKPPAPDVASRLVAAAGACGKPVVVCFVGATVAPAPRVEGAATLEDAARAAVRLAYGVTAEPSGLRSLPAQEARRMAPDQRLVRGLYSGGTLCYEALVLLRRYVGPIWSNTPLHPEEVLDPVTRSRYHTVIDMGGDDFTQGRLHPMIDPALRLQRLEQEAADPATAVVVLDFVLGYGAHPDPASVYAPAISRLHAQARAAGRRVSVVASICGTAGDPQDVAGQQAALVDAGVLVEESNARAVRLAGLIMEAIGSRGAADEPRVIEAAAHAPAWPDVEPVLAMLRRPPAVINVGLELFAESLTAQGVPVVSVDWRPPAGGKQHLLDLLDKLEA